MIEQKMLRKVVIRSDQKYKGYFPSKKLRTMDLCEILLGRNVIQQFEFSPGVIKYQKELKMTKHKHDEEVRIFYPDVEFVLASNDIINLEENPVSKMVSKNMHMSCNLWLGVRKDMTC